MNPEPIARHFADIEVGETASFEETVTADMVERFANFSGDHNPLHIDEAYASETMFHHRIPHGMIAGAFFSRLIGMHIPGLYSAYLSQTLTFHHPLPLGGVIIKGTVLEKSESTRTVLIATSVTDQAGKIFIKGEARVALLQ